MTRLTLPSLSEGTPSHFETKRIATLMIKIQARLQMAMSRARERPVEAVMRMTDQRRMVKVNMITRITR